MKVIYDNVKQKIPVKMWLEDVEESAMESIINLSNLPFAFKHIAIMPDCHKGYGMPIGGVLATNGVVIPNAVGVDIGCGMCAIKTSLNTKYVDTEIIKRIMQEIRDSIPVGFEHHKEKQGSMPMPKDLLSHHIVMKEFLNADKQIGTLGGGNHFIEIQKDNEGTIWVMIHSGSRNLGYKVAKHYNEVAVNLNSKWFSQVPEKWELAFLPIETQEAKDYLIEMQYCVDFAFANRKLMMDRIIQILINLDLFFHDFTGLQATRDSLINIAHNYAAWENHFGTNVMVHRKGATLAREGTIGIIPGSQGTKSYIVKGLGNKESFESCSHGAGRAMGRKDACRKLNLQDEIKKMNEQGIIHGLRTVENLEEAAGAYKNIADVMMNQKDLVEIVTELSPLAVIKGD
jgi:tRNA-splicing ligase RtcB